MKTYCKNLDLTDVAFIYNAITDYMHDKCDRKNQVHFFAKFARMPMKEIRARVKPTLTVYKNIDRKRYLFCHDPITAENPWEEICLRIAAEMSWHIEHRTVYEHIVNNTYGEKVIHYLGITDHGNGKQRELGLECFLFRLYEVVANAGADPLFQAKVGVFQIASIKGKGQKYGKQVIKRWLSQDPEGTKFGIQSDVRKCYPSIPHEPLLNMFRRDLKKSHDLLYLFETIICLYEEYPNPKSSDPTKGILIGSPVSKDMCNYYMSRLYHYASENVAVTKTRRGKTTRKRLLQHIIIYADDILIFGGNKRDLQKAMALLVRFAADELGLTIKPNWRKFRTMYTDKSGRAKGCTLDFVGFQFRCGEIRERYYHNPERRVRYRKVWVTIRRRTFLKARRKISRFVKMIKHKVVVTYKFAKGVAATFGSFKQTDSATYRKDNKIDQKVKIARKIVSGYAKGKVYNTEAYYRMWREKAA